MINDELESIELIEEEIKKGNLIIDKSGHVYFFNGSMGCGKTALLLKIHFNCTQDNEIPVLLLKPLIDNRGGKDMISSRMGTSAPAISIDKDDNIIDIVKRQKEKPRIIMIDEVQFFLPNQIIQLKDLADNQGITIHAYGLKVNFRGNIFGEKTGTIIELLKLCNEDIYLQSFCTCGNDATHIARYNPKTWEIQTKGPEILIGGNKRYIGLCHRCWKSGSVPRTARLKIYNSTKKEQEEKGNDANILKLNRLIEIEELAITNDELIRYQQIERDAANKVKELSMRIQKKTHY